MEYSLLLIQEIWRLVQSGDNAALDELVSRFEPLIISLSRFKGVRDEDIAQDIRETLVRAIKRHKSKSDH